MTQTRFTVLDETQRHPDLAEQIAQILHRVAPTVKEITDLPLPEEARFRLLGSALTAADGRRETIIAPRALHHGGLLVDEGALYQVAAHELVHQVQADARSGAVWTTFFPQKRGITAHGASAVLEGHTDWADHQATTRLLGTPADHRQSPKSWRYRVHNALPGIRRHGPSRAAYEQGSRLIGHAVTAGGTGLVNQIWKDAAFLPTELDDSSRTDRITNVVLDLLFELTHQIARFGVGLAPWAPLAAYYADEFAAFTAGGQA